MNSTGPHSTTDLFPSAEDFKVVLLGNSSVGKTSLSLKYVQDKFYENGIPTIGASYLSKTIWLESRRIRLQIWDTAGQERFRSLAPMYYRGAAAALLLFDITKKDTFNGVVDWMKELRTNLDEDIFLFVVGTHKDQEDKRQVDLEEAKNFAAQKGASYVEVSSKTGEGIDLLFLEIAKLLFQVDPNLQEPANIAKGDSRQQPGPTCTC